MKASNKDNFWKYCFQKEQAVDWSIVAGICIVGYIIIHLCYPFPDTYSDSFSYIRAAIDDEFSIFRPFGYSAFLQYIHHVSGSVHSVFIAQTLLYAISTGLLIIAMKRYFPIQRQWLRIILEVAIVCSPVAIYMLNTLMSDSLFCISIFLMLAMFVVTIMDDSWVASALFLLTFRMCLYTRYSAMFFPIAFIPPLLLYKNKLIKWATIAGICVVFAFFYNDTCTNMEKTVSHRQFSTGFDGWQLANNAMCMLPYIDVDKYTPSDRNVRELHEFSKYRFNDKIKEMTHNGTSTCASFLWKPEFPLKQYLFYKIQTTGKPYQVLWARLGATTYSDYGKWLIKKYPQEFWKYYLSLNIREAFYPKNLEIINGYSTVNEGNKELNEWFNYNEPMKERYPLYSEHFNKFLPALELLTWGLVLLSLLILLCFYSRWTMEEKHHLIFWLLFLFAFIFYGTTIFASPIAIRYWMPMQAVKIAFVWSLVPQFRQIINYAKTHRENVSKVN